VVVVVRYDTGRPASESLLDVILEASLDTPQQFVIILFGTMFRLIADIQLHHSLSTSERSTQAGTVSEGWWAKPCRGSRHPRQSDLTMERSQAGWRLAFFQIAQRRLD